VVRTQPKINSMRRPILSIAALCLTASGASALGFKTQLSCASDYYSYCSQHSVGTPGLRACMRANGPRLSKSCINALIADGEISKAEVEREREKVLASRARPKAAEPKKTEAATAKTTTGKTSEPGTKTKLAVKKAPPEPAKSKVATAPAPQKPREQRAARPLTIEAIAPAAVAQGAVRQTVSLDQPTYEALRARGPHFLSTGDETEPAIEPRLIDAQVPPVRAAAAAGPALPARAREDAVAESEPPERPTPNLEGRMSLGRNISSPQPASWWDELVRALFGD
jgi:hypothetical protein